MASRAPWFLILAAWAGPAPCAPVNLAPNSQWEIFSAEGFAARWTIDGQGPMAGIAATGNTTGRNAVTFTLAGPTGDLKVGDLVTASGDGIDPVLARSPMRVIALAPGRSVTVNAPSGDAPTVSRGAVLTPVNIGGEAATHTGDAADGWTKTISLPVWREDNAANLSPGALYALGAHKDRAGPEMIYLTPDVARYRGRTLSFGVLVYHKLRLGAGDWTLFFASDGPGAAVVVSAPPPAGPGYQWLELRYSVPADATGLRVGVVLDGAAGDTYYLADPVLARDDVIGRDNYQKPQETFIPVVHVTPITWENATVAFTPVADAREPHTRLFDLYAETGGKVAPSVRLAQGAIEGVNAGAVVAGPAARVIAWASSPAAPNLFGPILAETGTNVKAFGALSLPLDGQGRAWFASGVLGDVWTNVSMDLCLFYLQ